MIFLLKLDSIYEILINEKSVLNFRQFFTSIIGQYTIFLIGVLIIFLIGITLKFIKYDFKYVSMFLDFSSIALVILLVFQIVANWSSSSDSLSANEEKTQQLWETYSQQVVGGLPNESTFHNDIYYLILDGYGDKVSIKNLCGNESGVLFTNLSNLGFHIIPDARPNYNQTRFSVTSALNFTYIQDLQVVAEVSGDDESFPLLLINQNLISKFLRNIEYETITFRTSLNQTNIFESDYYLSPANIPSPFIESLINNTFLSLFFWKSQYYWHADNIEYVLHEITNVHKNGNPIFVYAHFLIPHPPFLFNAEGVVEIPPKKFDLRDNSAFIELDSRSNYVEGYCNQVNFVNKRITEIANRLIQDSPDAIIIIQGDHGPGADFYQEDFEKSNIDQKFHILNAIYFPDQDYSLLSDDITPINTVRLILNKFFNSTLPLLENRTFYSTYAEPYTFIDVTDYLR